MNQLGVSLGCVVGSAAVHAALLFGAPEHVVMPRLPRPPAVVQVRVMPAAVTPPPAIEPRPLPPSPPKLTPKPILPAKTRSAPPESVAAEPPDPEPSLTEPAEPVPAELTGTTLASDGSAAWSTLAGNAAPRRDAVTSGTHPARGLAPAAKSPPTLSTAATATAVPLAQLSKRPEPPPLTRALERNYPARARSLGRSGEAKVRARIERDGTLQVAKLLFETSAGFGEACRSTLLASRWTAPLDARGKPAATWITYVCKFRIGG